MLCYRRLEYGEGYIFSIPLTVLNDNTIIGRCSAGGSVGRLFPRGAENLGSGHGVVHSRQTHKYIAEPTDQAHEDARQLYLKHHRKSCLLPRVLDVLQTLRSISFASAPLQQQYRKQMPPS